MESASTAEFFRDSAVSPAVLENRADYIRQVRAGIPGAIVKRAVELFDNRELLVRLLHTSSANLSRYYRRKALTPAESEEILDALRIFFEAVEILGNTDTARAWLHTPVPALAGERPTDLFDTFEGREWVRQVLRKIAHGEFT